MVQLTFFHARDIFYGNEFNKWVYKFFPSARFKGFMWGNWFPTLEIPYNEFETGHKNIPARYQSKIAGIKANPNVLEMLALGVRPIHKITNLHPDFEKVTGRESYGKTVEEIIEI